MKQYEEPTPNVPQLSSKNKSIPAHISTPVRVVDDCSVATPIEEAKRTQKFAAGFKCFNECKNEGGEEGLPIKLYHPASKYWFLHHLAGKMTDEKFKENARKQLSVSFLYLLTECARVLRCDLRSLYQELAHIEFTYATLFGDDPEYCAGSPFVLLPPEW